MQLIIQCDGNGILHGNNEGVSYVEGERNNLIPHRDWKKHAHSLQWEDTGSCISDIDFIPMHNTYVPVQNLYLRQFIFRSKKLLIR